MTSALLLSSACQDLTAPDSPRLSPTDANPTLIGASSTDIIAELRTLGDNPTASIQSINEGGQVAGAAFGIRIGGGDWRSYRWIPGQGISRVDFQGGTQMASDINNSGVVVGTNRGGQNGPRPFRAVGAIGVALPLLPGAQFGTGAVAYAINDAGVVVGSAGDVTSTQRAVLWTPSNVIQDLGTPLGTVSEAFDINNAGQVIGTSGRTTLGAPPAPPYFLWTSAVGIQDLTPILGTATSLIGINDAGQMAGAFTTAAGETHAFLYTPGSGVRDLGTLGGSFSAATGLNNNGQVVGNSTRPDGTMQSFLWTPTDGMEDITAITGVAGVRLLNNNLQTTSRAGTGWGSYSASEYPQVIQLRVTPNAAPVARFTWSCSDTTCSLDATTSSDDKTVVSYTWNLDKFPDGSASGATVTANYPHEGTRNVTLTVTDANGLSNSVTRTIQIGGSAPPVNQAPVARFTTSCTILDCTFDSAASSDDAGIVSRSWSFGDGGTAGDVVAPSYRYPAAGTYNVTLTVTDEGGLTHSTTTQVTVRLPSDQAPVARFTYSCTGTTCVLDASSSRDDGYFESFTWDLGRFPDGTATGRTTTVTYPHSGTRYVKLTVTDNIGQSSSITQTIEVP